MRQMVYPWSVWISRGMRRARGGIPNRKAIRLSNQAWRFGQGPRRGSHGGDRVAPIGDRGSGIEVRGSRYADRGWWYGDRGWWYVAGQVDSYQLGRPARVERTSKANR